VITVVEQFQKPSVLGTLVYASVVVLCSPCCLYGSIVQMLITDTSLTADRSTRPGVKGMMI